MGLRTKIGLFVLCFGLVISFQNCSSGFRTDIQSPSNNSILELSFKNFTLNNLETYFQIPVNPSGVIYFFHGTGGSASHSSSQVEVRLFAKAAVNRGFAVVFLESTNRTTKQWTPTATPSTNPDIIHITNVRNYLRSNEGLSSSLPEYGIGMSNGGGYVPYAGYYFNYSAVAIYCAAGYNAVLSLSDYSMPTIFLKSVNDSIVLGTDIDTNYNLLVGKSVRTQLLTNTEDILTTNRFTRIDGITSTDSQNIFNSLVNSGLINNSGIFLKSSRDLTVNDVPTQYLSKYSDISSQLDAVYAEHQFTSEFTEETLNFFQ